FGDEGIQVAFEAVGDERALDDAVQNVEKGGRVVVLGVFPERPRVDMSVVGDRELQLIGTLMYRQCDFQQAVDWLEKRRIRVDHLISRTFAFHEYAEAYRYLDANLERTMKVLIDLER
ncbi:MAG: Zn-dependent alcohol dehydrogenase, partial [Lentisphaerae bacterium]